jgi:hypothetical protein
LAGRLKGWLWRRGTEELHDRPFFCDCLTSSFQLGEEWVGRRAEVVLGAGKLRDATGEEGNTVGDGKPGVEDYGAAVVFLRSWRISRKRAISGSRELRHEKIPPDVEAGKSSFERHRS